MKSKYYLAFIPLLLLCIHPNVGLAQTGANLLTIYPGARAIAMGGAFTGIADDASCTYYNSAGLGFIDRAMTSSSYLRWQFGSYPDIHYMSLAGAFPVGLRMGLGYNVAFLTAGDVITCREVTSEECIGEINQGMSYDLAVGVNYGWRILRKFGTGIGIKYIMAHHYTCWGPWETGNTLAADVSLLYKGKLSFGATIQNIGSDLVYDETGRHDPLPKILRIGAAWEILSYIDECTGIDPPILTVSAQANKLSYETDLAKIMDDFKNIDDISWQAGMEYWFYSLALRVGYFYDKYERNRLKNGLTYGVGLGFAGLALNFTVDSSIHDFPESNYYFTLSGSF